jgi:hypothetical protein
LENNLRPNLEQHAANRFGANPANHAYTGSHRSGDPKDGRTGIIPRPGHETDHATRVFVILSHGASQY